MMIDRFGDAYRQYRQKVGAVIPKAVRGQDPPGRY
jgi:protein-S-isoprenylcysteine O-methyltransferase Ste14